MKNWYTALLAVSSCFLLLAFAGFRREKHFVVTDFGAKGDSSTLNTVYIQKAIDECAAGGGGVVVIPQGVFISGALFLKQGVNLLVEKGGCLRGSLNPDDYPQLPTRWEGEEMTWTSAFINITDQEGTHIYGEGMIDGAGEAWLKRAREGKQAGKPAVRVGRPRLICFQNCRNVTIEGLQLHNQAVWCLHILYSKQVTVRNLTITAQHDIPSSDGIDVDSSEDVLIAHTFIDVNDDCISIKSGKDEDGRRVNKPSRHIVIDSCHFAYGHGGVAIGSEVSGGIRDVLVSNCVADGGNWAPVRFKSQPSRGGVVEDITYRNMVLHNTGKAFEFNMAWRMVGTVKPAARELTIVRNIRMEQITGDVKDAGDMTGLEASPIQGVTFTGCRIHATTGLRLQHVVNIDTSGLYLQVDKGEKIIRL